MNYQKIYDDLCKRGQERILPEEVYTEKHHIIPKCLGGGNEKSNLTVLTAREHFLVHYILADRLYPKNPKLWFAFWKMLTYNEYQERYIPNSKIYEYVKQKYSETNKGPNNQNFGRKHSDEVKQEMSRRRKGNKKPAGFGKYLADLYSGKTFEERFGEERAKQIKDSISNSTDHRGDKNPNFGKITPLEVRNKISESLKGNNPSIETRQKIREKAIGRNHSEETKQKCRESASKQSDETKKRKSENCAKNKKCEIDGVEFRSAALAARFLNIPSGIVCYRINNQSNKWKNWKYI